MSKFSPGLFIILFTILLSYPVLQAQDSCGGYYPFEEGVSFELTSYDKKDKVESVTKNYVKEVRSDGGAQIAIIHTEVTDDKGEETVNTDYEITCEGGQITVDINSVLKERINSSLSNSNSSASADVTGTNPVMPNDLQVGQTLPETGMEMDVSSGTMNMKFTVRSYDKKVEGTETVTTPAGTFDCVVISSKTDTKMLIAKHTTSKTWYAKGVGQVKEESYNKKGKLVSRQVLTAFSK